MEEIKNTPIGIISRKYWESHIGNFLKSQKEEQSLEFLRELVEEAERGIHKERVYFFNAEKTTAEIKEILKVLEEHTSIPGKSVKAEIFHKILKSENFWREKRANIDKHEKLNYLQQPINFYALQQAQPRRNEATSNDQREYTRRLRVLLALVESYGIQELKAWNGEDEGAWEWMVEEIMTGYMLTKDLIITHSTKSEINTEKKEEKQENEMEWIILSNKITEFVLQWEILGENALRSEKHREIIHQSLKYYDRILNQEEQASSVEEYFGFSIFLSKIIQGKGENATNLIKSHYRTFFTLENIEKANKSEAKRVYEEILASKIVETLNHEEMKAIKGQDTFEYIINQIMNYWEELSASQIQLFIEYLIYFIQSEPIQKNKSQMQVIFTLFTFLNEWENSIHSKKMKNNAIRLEWIKFCYILLENQSLHGEFELFQIEFIVKFLQSSLEAIKRDPLIEQMKIHSVVGRAEAQLEYLIHFYSFKLARYLFLFYKKEKHQNAAAFDKNLEASFKHLFNFFVFYFLQLKFIEFMKEKNELIYFPADESFFNAISQAILFSTELPGEFIEHFLSISSATHLIVKDLFHLLNFPHLFVQKAAFYLLSHLFRYSSSESIQYLLFPSPPSLALSSSSSSLSFIDLVNCDDFHIDKFVPEYLLTVFLLDINHFFSSFLDDPSIHYSFRILSSLSFHYLLSIYLLCIYYSKLVCILFP